MSEKEAEIRASLSRLDEAVSNDATGSTLTADDLSQLRRQLEESQLAYREQHDRAKQVQDENEMLLRRRHELETRLATLEAEYEELLGMRRAMPGCTEIGTDKLNTFAEADRTIQEDEKANHDVSADIKVCAHL